MSQPASRPASENRPLLAAFVGNPNVGKTTLFNALTGMRQKVGNYPGVTVEHKVGYSADEQGTAIECVDVPGLYSLTPRSRDEEIAYQVLTGELPGSRRPDVIVVVVDAANLERNLYLASQVLDLGIPTVIALNMMDDVAKKGHRIDVDTLAATLGVTVVPTVGTRRHSALALRNAITRAKTPPRANRFILDEDIEAAVAELAPKMVQQLGVVEAQSRAAALRLLCSEADTGALTRVPAALAESVRRIRAELAEHDKHYRHAEASGRYAWLTPMVADLLSQPDSPPRTASDYIDAVLTQRIAGPLIFFFILAVIFQAVFSWATPLMDGITNAATQLGTLAHQNLPAGPLTSLLTGGVIAGVGAVVVFLPQILILFFFLGLMEDTGYMARAAFIMDRVMRKVGLSGQSVVPLLSSFACAIPGIMAARTITNPRDRLVTILVAPLMTCSARLPVYALLIAAFIPRRTVWGPFGLQGLTLLLMYLLGIGFAIAAAAVIKRYVVHGSRSTFIMELPPYRWPRIKDVLWRMLERSRIFLRRAGTIILSVSIVLWFLASFPMRDPDPKLVQQADQARAEFDAQLTPALAEFNAKDFATLVRTPPVARQWQALAEHPRGTTAAPSDIRRLFAARQAMKQANKRRNAEQASRQIHQSIMGQMGHVFEPLIAPLGFDWKIGVALISSMAAREVAVSAMATIYSVANADETSQSLHHAMRADRYPDTGLPVFTTLVALSLMIYYVLACQCMSTIAIVRRETNSWRWPAFMFTYMTALAWIASFAVYQGGKALGYA